jgi:hypothetical protein
VTAARALSALGLVLLVAGSCTNDFEQFDFEPAASGRLGTAGTIVYAGSSSVMPGSGGSAGRGGGGRPGAGGEGESGGTGGTGGTAGTDATGGSGGRAGDAGGDPGGAGGESGTAGEAGAGTGSGGAPGCPSDQRECDGSCVPLLSPDHCVTCGNACVGGFVCTLGGCACDGDLDCGAPGAGEGGNGGEAGGGGAPSSSVACIAGSCVCGVTLCDPGERCQSDGSCG